MEKMEKYKTKATTIAPLNRRERKYSRFNSGDALTRSIRTNPARAITPTRKSPMTNELRYPSVSPRITANVNAPSPAAPTRNPGMSRRDDWGLDDSGTVFRASSTMSSAAPTLNQNTPRQSPSATRMPPITGPKARARPETAAQVPMARARMARSGYM